VRIEAYNLCCSYPQQENELLQNLNLTLKAQIYFLVGANGIGKSTLARLLSTPGGNVKHFGKIGYLEQSEDTFEGTVAEKLCIQSYRSALQRIERGEIHEKDFKLLENNWDIEFELKKQLSEYGLPDHILDWPYQLLSGGQRTRLNLLALHRQDCDFYILDEPTNHLDQKGRQWLLRWIKHHKACFIISHDLSLLQTSDVIWELTAQGIQAYHGGWRDYQMSKQQSKLYNERKLKETQKELKEAKRHKQRNNEKMQSKQSAGQKNSAKGGQSKLVINKKKETSEATKSRETQLHKARVRDANQAYQNAKAAIDKTKPQDFVVSPVDEKKKSSLIMSEVTIPHVDRLTISYHLPFGERLWIKGDNGSGKSTLLKVINGTLESVNGYVKGPHYSLLLDQHFTFLDENISVLQNFKAMAPGLSNDYYRTVLARIGFRNQMAHQPVSTLSGGEKLKLALACLFSGQYAPSLLLLDEPDNHLDLESKNLLTETLKRYEGSIILVSHDEAFVSSLNVNYSLELYI